MYANPGSEICPLQTFQKYLSHLNPKLNALLQKPKSKVYEQVWYCNSPVGVNTLSKMMSVISKKYNLSEIYTNHCMRVTSMQTMERNDMEGRDIIRVTGHKSEKSINQYARTLSTTKKRKISHAFTSTLSGGPSSSTETLSKPPKSVETVPEIPRLEIPPTQIVPRSPQAVSIEESYSLSSNRGGIVQANFQ